MTRQLQFWEPPRSQAETAVLPHRRKTSTVGGRSGSKIAEPPRADHVSISAADSGRDQASTLQHLRRQIRQAETKQLAAAVAETISCGATVLDRMLPQGGLPRAAMSEWIASAAGLGASWLSLTAAAQAMRESSHGKALVVLDQAHTFYPPAVFALGIPASRIILLRPSSHADLVWSADQALRSPAISAVWGSIGDGLDDRDARRLQLAAETGNTTALFVRPATVMGAPSFAAVRWHVRGLASSGSSRRLQVELARCRGGVPGGVATVTIDSETGAIQHAAVRSDRDQQQGEQHESVRQPRTASSTAATMHLVSQLADPTMASRTRSRRGQRHSA